MSHASPPSEAGSTCKQLFLLISIFLPHRMAPWLPQTDWDCMEHNAVESSRQMLE
jgi:hypothetical protein